MGPPHTSMLVELAQQLGAGPQGGATPPPDRAEDVTLVLARLVEAFLAQCDGSGRAPAARSVTAITAALSQLPQRVRRKIARRYAHSGAIPCQIVRQLALDDLPVASEMLRHNPQLGQDVLLAVAATAPPERARCIAGRGDLGPVVEAALMARGDPQIAAVRAEARRWMRAYQLRLP